MSTFTVVSFCAGLRCRRRLLGAKRQGDVYLHLQLDFKNSLKKVRKVKQLICCQSIIIAAKMKTTVCIIQCLIILPPHKYSWNIVTIATKTRKPYWINLSIIRIMPQFNSENFVPHISYQTWPCLRETIWKINTSWRPHSPMRFGEPIHLQIP